MKKSTTNTDNSGASIEHDEWYSWGALVVVVAIVVGAIFWFAGQQEEMRTQIPGVDGIQGTLTSITPNERSFTLERRRLVQNEEEEPFFETSTFTLFWDEETEFYTYDKLIAVERDITTRANMTALQTGHNVIVTPVPSIEDSITAAEIRVLPNTSQTDKEPEEEEENTE